MSINLTDALVVIKGQDVVESSSSAAITALAADYNEISPVVILTLKMGSVQGKNLIPSTLVSSQVSLSIDLISGAWGTDNGQSGVLSADDLKGLVQSLAIIRNATESLFVKTSTVIGTQVPWDTATVIAADALPIKI